MTKKYLLPPLKGNSDDINCEKCWEETFGPYDFLFRNLKLQYESNKSVFEGGSNAMPHLYEQMIVFQDAFFDPEHKEHDRAVNEWRAVLMIMALQRILSIKVSLKKVEFAEESPNPFLRAAWMMCPKSLPVFYQTTWDFLYVLCVKDVPVAVFSPITLVCPAKQFYTRVSEVMDIKWLHLGKVNGREEIWMDFYQKEESYASLVFWLDNIRHELGCAQKDDGRSNEHFNKVIKEINSFIEDCQKKCQAINTCQKNDIYPVIRDNARKEYAFFNKCSDFIVPDENMAFLADCYQDDIFQSRLAIVTFDERSDTMEQEGNVRQLDLLFHHIVHVDKRLAIGVWDRGGKRLAACVLLPFKEAFIEELIRHRVTSDELFEKFTVTYDVLGDYMEVIFQIKGFPYVFTKNYKRTEWKYLYSQHLDSVCLWPNGQIKTVDWKAYFTYAETNGKGIDISVPGMIQEIQYDKFKLIRTDSFPSYLKLSTGEVTGYLPIRTEQIGKSQSGAIANVFIDMGHATTYLAIMKQIRNDANEVDNERITFSVPNSLKVIGRDNEKDFSGNNFVPAMIKTDLTDMFVKNMFHDISKCKDPIPAHIKMRPMGDGQILFGNDYGLWGMDQLNVEFLYFEYNNMAQVKREKVHTMVEELLLYAAYEAMKNDCTSLKVHFLHEYEKNDERFGELYGLWENALNWVKSWTGMSKVNGQSVEGMQKYKALTWNVLRHVHEQKIHDIPKDEVYVGIDIGWKTTVLTALKAREDQSDIDARYAVIQFAGLDISTMRDNDLSRTCVLKQYPQILSVLLNGSADIHMSSDTKILLEKFQEMYLDGGENCRECYQGLFDVIAMKIDEGDFVIPPDVYNNMMQFRLFLKMMTYNLILLFIEIGCLLGRIEGRKKKLYIYLYGNGSKFLKWISNEKQFTEITEVNSHELWIVKMKNDFLYYLKRAIQVTGEDVCDEIQITIEKRAKQQMLEGYLYKECSTMLTEEDKYIQFNIIEDCLKEDQGERLSLLLSEVYEDVFDHDLSDTKGDAGPSGEGCQTRGGEKDDTLAGTDTREGRGVNGLDMINDERRRVCKAVIEEINNM